MALACLNCCSIWDLYERINEACVTMHLKSGNTMAIKRDKFFNAYFMVLFMLMVLLSSATRAESRPATDYLKETLDKIIEVLNDPSLKTPGKENERRNILLKLVRERFDEEEFARRALGGHWRGRTKEEKQEFIGLFSELLARTYIKKIDDYLAKAGSFSGKNIRYLDETVKGSYMVVSTKILTSENTEIPILYLSKTNQGNWLVCDVAIEGVSIAQNYRAQFNDILSKSSFKELVAKLKSKQQTESTEQKK
jgi:phospholipid transport system substrate-binding protein